MYGKTSVGLLVESVWSGEDIDSLVIGMGINVYKDSVPPADMLQFPATSLEEMLGQKTPKREEILLSVLDSFMHWREHLGTNELILAWEERLAFRGKQVEVKAGNESPISGVVDGLESDGSLRLKDLHDNSVIVRFGDVSLRPAA